MCAGKKSKKNHVAMTCSFSALDGLYYITNRKISQDFSKIAEQKRKKLFKNCVYNIYLYIIIIIITLV